MYENFKKGQGNANKKKKNKKNEVKNHNIGVMNMIYGAKNLESSSTSENLIESLTKK
jgi:hypothetical protein